jgi:hypothetical protein
MDPMLIELFPTTRYVTQSEPYAGHVIDTYLLPRHYAFCTSDERTRARIASFEGPMSWTKMLRACRKLNGKDDVI